MTSPPKGPPNTMNADDPTTYTYAGFTKAYNHFNRTLFQRRLPAVMITQSRKNGTMGFCRPAAFQSANGGVTVDEISLNPTYFDHRDRMEILSTLVHEMTHVEEFVNGTHLGGGYHNEIWGTLMERVGLMPSGTVEQGGKPIGTHMSHYVIKGGHFEREAERFLSRTVFAPMDARRYTAEEKIKI
jgi:hypothetical protein